MKKVVLALAFAAVAIIGCQGQDIGDANKKLEPGQAVPGSANGGGGAGPATGPAKGAEPTTATPADN